VGDKQPHPFPQTCHKTLEVAGKIHVSGEHFFCPVLSRDLPERGLWASRLCRAVPGNITTHCPAGILHLKKGMFMRGDKLRENQLPLQER